MIRFWTRKMFKLFSLSQSLTKYWSISKNHTAQLLKLLLSMVGIFVAPVNYSWTGLYNCISRTDYLSAVLPSLWTFTDFAFIQIPKMIRWKFFSNNSETNLYISTNNLHNNRSRESSDANRQIFGKCLATLLISLVPLSI